MAEDWLWTGPGNFDSGAYTDALPASGYDFFGGATGSSDANLWDNNWFNGTNDGGGGYADFFQNPGVTDTSQLPNWSAGTPDTNWWDSFSSGAGNLLSGAANLPWQNILGGAAGIGTIAGLFQNGKYPGGSTVSAQQQLRPWWEEGAMQGVSEAGSIGPYESQLDTPGTMLRNTDIGEYMNPFIEQTLDPVLRNMDIEQADEQNQMAANAAKVGAFGGSRPALDQSLALERQGRRRDEAISGAYRSAYDNAQTGALSDIGRTWGDIGLRYEDPYRQVGALGDMLAQTKTAGNQTETTTQAKRSPWETLAGAGMTGLSLYNMMQEPKKG